MIRHREWGDYREEFAVNWLNGKDPAPIDFQVFASVHVEDVRVVVVSDYTNIGWMYFSWQVGGSWVLGPMGRHDDLSKDEITVIGSFDVGNQPGVWYSVVFGRRSDLPEGALLVQDEHAEPLLPDSRGVFLQIRRMTHRQGNRLEIRHPQGE